MTWKNRSILGEKNMKGNKLILSLVNFDSGLVVLDNPPGVCFGMHSTINPLF